MSEEPKISMEAVVRSDGRYPLEAYAFLHEGLSRAVKQVHGGELPEGAASHVTGQDLCHALRELAIERWGMLALTVLGRWNIRATIDFGNMVYLLIQHGYMRKTDEDSLEDFRDVYDFAKAFDVGDQFEIKHD